MNFSPEQIKWSKRALNEMRDLEKKAETQGYGLQKLLDDAHAKRDRRMLGPWSVKLRLLCKRGALQVKLDVSVVEEAAKAAKAEEGGRTELTAEAIKRGAAHIEHDVSLVTGTPHEPDVVKGAELAETTAVEAIKIADEKFAEVGKGSVERSVPFAKLSGTMAEDMDEDMDDSMFNVTESDDYGENSTNDDSKAAEAIERGGDDFMLDVTTKDDDYGENSTNDDSKAAEATVTDEIGRAEFEAPAGAIQRGAAHIEHVVSLVTGTLHEPDVVKGAELASEPAVEAIKIADEKVAEVGKGSVERSVPFAKLSGTMGEESRKECEENKSAMARPPVRRDIVVAAVGDKEDASRSVGELKDRTGGINEAKKALLVATEVLAKQAQAATEEAVLPTQEGGSSKTSIPPCERQASRVTASSIAESALQAHHVAKKAKVNEDGGAQGKHPVPMQGQEQDKTAQVAGERDKSVAPKAPLNRGRERSLTSAVATTLRCVLLDVSSTLNAPLLRQEKGGGVDIKFPCLWSSIMKSIQNELHALNACLVDGCHNPLPQRISSTKCWINWIPKVREAVQSCKLKAADIPTRLAGHVCSKSSDYHVVGEIMVEASQGGDVIVDVDSVGALKKNILHLLLGRGLFVCAH